MPHDANGAESPAASSIVHIDNGSSAPSSSTVHAPSSTSDLNTSAAPTTTNITTTTSGEHDGGSDHYLELRDYHEPPLPIGMLEAQLDEAEAEGKSSAKLEQIKDDEGPHHASAMLAASLEATNKSPLRRYVETINDSSGPIPFDSTQFQDAKDVVSSNLTSLPQPQPIRLEPPRPFNLADFDEEEDAKLKSNQVAAYRDEGSIVVPTEEDIADGAVLDRATTRDTRRTGNNQREVVDLERGNEETPQLETEDANVYATGAGPNNDAGPFDSELPVLEAYTVEEESEQEVFIATHVEPSLPWWKQRRNKFLLGMVFVVVTALAIALGVSLTGDSAVIVVEQTDAPSVSHVPTSFPSISSRPSSDPSLPPTTTPSLSPTFTRLTSSKLVPDDGSALDSFGKSVAIYDSTVVVGAWGDDDKGDQSGSAYIYQQDFETNEWILQQKIVPDDGTKYDYFGRDVAIFDNTLVVGAPGDDTDKGDDSGSVYIYSREPTTNEWILHQKLVADDGAANDEFGKSIAIYNNTIVVGAPDGDDDKGLSSGSVYIYYRDLQTKEWVLQQKLVLDDGAGNEHFGWSVAIYDDTVIVGAWGDDDRGYSSGSAYIYHLDPGTKKWTLQQKLVPDDGSAEFNFGWSVTIYENVVAVGAWRDSNMGSAYVYQRNPETKLWSLQQKIVAHDGAAIDSFGESVAIYDNTLVVGANWDDDEGNSSGSAYIYHQDSDTNIWILQEKLVPSDGEGGDEFGVSVAIYDGTVVVGADGDGDKGRNSGSIYVYS